MRLYPAIDLKDGKCVRLVQGDYDAVTVFDENPVSVAKRWEEEGGSYLHLVDLDGAKAGYGINDELIAQIIKNISIPVELGGGIRTLEAIETKLELGVSRVILGSVAVKEPQLVQQAIDRFGSERVVVGVDAKEGKLAVEGWCETTDQDVVEFCHMLKRMGVKTVIYTDIAKDGMMQGPNVEMTRRLVEATGLDVVASGGVACLEDLHQVEQVGVEGAIIGKALYTGAIALKNAVKRFEGEKSC